MSKPNIPDIPKQEKIESVKTITETAEERRKKVKIPRGRETALLAGVSNALSKRLG